MINAFQKPFCITNFLVVISLLFINYQSSDSRASSNPVELFISEYIKGSINNKAIEIYNGTGSTVDLSAGNYDIQMFFNGNSNAGLTISLSGSVTDSDVYVVAYSSANATILGQAEQTNGAGWFNGNDTVVLRKDEAVIDAIGQIGFDPGAEWGSGDQSSADNTLQCKEYICFGDSETSNTFEPILEWDGYAQDTFDGLGTHIAECGTSLMINKVDVEQAHTDTAEFVEIYDRGVGNTSLDGLVLIFF